MVRLDLSTWGHTLADLRRLAINAQHPRSHERLALYMIAPQQTNATTWAVRIGRTMEERCHETLHAFAMFAIIQLGSVAL